MLCSLYQVFVVALRSLLTISRCQSNLTAAGNPRITTHHSINPREQVRVFVRFGSCKRCLKIGAKVETVAVPFKARG